MRLLAVAAIAACSSSPPRSSPAGAQAEVVVIAAGEVSVAPALEALAETLPPGSDVAVIAEANLAASIDKAIARLEGSDAPVRAVIAVGGSAPAPGERVAAMRRAGILGYSIRIGDDPGAELDRLGYTAARRIETAEDLRGVAGAIGAAIGSR